MEKGKYLLDNKKDIVKELYLNSNLSLTKIAEQLGVSRQTVTNFVKKEGLYQPAIKTRAVRTYAFDESFFEEINSEDKAYWLGFIAADGGIRQDGLRLTIELAIKDKEHLEKFNCSIHSQNPIKEYQREYPSATAVINSKKVCIDLAKYGIIPNKTENFDFNFALIPQKFMSDFIRGYFDGDGSIYQESRGTWGINFTGNMQFLNKLNKYLPVQIHLRDKETYGILETQNSKNIETILHFMYDDSTIYLERKFLKTKQFLQALNDYQ